MERSVRGFRRYGPMRYPDERVSAFTPSSPRWRGQSVRVHVVTWTA